MSACFDELTYLHCSVFSFVALRGSKASFIWSTETKPIRYKISDVNPGQLSSDLGLSIAGGLHPGIDKEGGEREHFFFFPFIFHIFFLTLFVELNYEALAVWGLDGYSWITQPSNDPLVFYPPYIEFAYNYTEAPIDAYIDAGFSETKSNIGLFFPLFFPYFSIFFFFFLDILIDNAILFILQYLLLTLPQNKIPLFVTNKRSWMEGLFLFWGLPVPLVCLWSFVMMMISIMDDAKEVIIITLFIFFFFFCNFPLLNRHIFRNYSCEEFLDRFFGHSNLFINEPRQEPYLRCLIFFS